MVKRAIELDGTCTGEHGVGTGKRQYLPLEHDPAAINLMRQLKRTIDPDNILNPGKILPPED
jgi:D-lactate dehydrogenase (cytochrome)